VEINTWREVAQWRGRTRTNERRKEIRKQGSK
jgi:hypothetical protein